MAAMKANGKLKSYLSGCTYGEAVSRISQVARDQDVTALKELQTCLRDVPGDGSCGYDCMMLLLRRMKLIDNTLSVSQFCCGIHQFIVSNMKKIVGVCPDGNDAMFQYPWGQMSCLKKKSCDPTTSRTRFMTTKVMSGIWSKRVYYSSPVSKAQWMDSAYLFPVIEYKYKIGQLVLYNNSATHTHCVDGGRCFTTYVYCYNKSKCYVSMKTIPVLVHDISASRNACMVFFCEQSHFMLFEYLIHVHKIYDKLNWVMLS